MFEDRRDNTRHPTLLRTLVTVGRERFDVVCTDTSATGAFFTTRNPPPVGAEVVVELRAGGVDSPIVFLNASVSRTCLMGSSGPIGFGVTWRSAHCDAGPEPLFRVLRQILHLALVDDADLTQGRTAEYVFRAAAVGMPPESSRSVTPNLPPSAPASRPSSVRQALGVWSAPVHRATGGIGRDAPAPDSGRQPAQHPVELEPQAPVSPLRGAQGRAAVSTVRAAAPADALDRRPVSSPLRPSDGSVLFGGLSDRSSVGVGRNQDNSAPPSDDVSQSWPVYALAPGERRAVSDPQVAAPYTNAPSPPPHAPTARHASGAIAEESVIARPPRLSGAIPNHPVVAPGPQPGSQPFDAIQQEQTDPTAPPPARKPEGAGMLVAADVPVTFVRQNQFVPGHLTGIAEQLACVVTSGGAPGLDEQLVIYLPVRVDGVWRTVQLAGKLLQVATEVAAGKRFVMHIERTDEGRYKGAFHTFLQALRAP